MCKHTCPCDRVRKVCPSASQAQCASCKTGRAQHLQACLSPWLEQTNKGEVTTLYETLPPSHSAWEASPREMPFCKTSSFIKTSYEHRGGGQRQQEEAAGLSLLTEATPMLAQHQHQHGPGSPAPGEQWWSGGSCRHHWWSEGPICVGRGSHHLTCNRSNSDSREAGQASKS